MNGSPYTLITGASSGIGKAMAEECARRQMNLLMVALPDASLDIFAEELREKYSVDIQTLGLDLLSEKAPLEILNWCQEKEYGINMLLNNIGIGGRCDFGTSTLPELNNMLSLNINTATLLSRLFVDKLKEYPQSYILNVGSAAGFFHIPYKAVYSASKAYLYSFSRATRTELKPYGIHVALLCPGGADNRADPAVHQKVNGWVFRNLHHSTDHIAKVAIHGLLNRKKVIIPGFLPKIYIGLGRFFPSLVVDNVVGFLFKKQK